MYISQIEEDFYINLTQKILFKANSRQKPSDDEIKRAHSILGKSFIILNIKTGEVEQIVKEIYDKKLLFTSYLNIAEKLFQTDYYMYGAAAIIVLGRNKRLFNNLEDCKTGLLRFKSFFEEGYIDSWPYTDSLCLKVIHYILKKQSTLWSEVKGWSANSNPWLKRASLVAFVKLIKDKDNPKEFFELAIPLITQENIMVQKGVGWFLKETFKHFPNETTSFITGNIEKIPRLVIRTALEKMSKDQRNLILNQKKKKSVSIKHKT
ncbi:MAG: DNA alkylation repair protein [Candidatus Hodarchaeales archaeon]